MASTRMATTTPLDIEGLLLGPLEGEIFHILDEGMNIRDEFAADYAAARIDELFQRYQGIRGQTEDSIEEFLRRLWTLIISMATQMQSDDERFDMLVQILKRLNERDSGMVMIWSGPVVMWDDMPLLGKCMREALNFAFETTLACLPSEWISMQSLFARLHGKWITRCTGFAVSALRKALEEPLPTPGPVRDAILEVACQWIQHAGRVLYERALCSTKLVECEAWSLGAGELAQSMETDVTERRWIFWRQRLEELGRESEQEVKQKVEQAARYMKVLEEEEDEARRGWEEFEEAVVVEEE